MTPSPLSPPPANPYAPPGAVAAHPLAQPAHASGRALAAMFAAYIALSLAFGVLRLFVPSVETPWTFVFAVALDLAHYLIVLAWVYLAWQGIPPSHRGTMSPWRAALTFFIPFYDLYWAYAMNVALCDTLDGILVSADSKRRAPRTLAIVASTTWVSSLALAVVFNKVHRGGFTLALAMGAGVQSLWLAYMVLCDRAREEVARLGVDASALGAPRLSRIQRKKGPHPVAAIAVSIIAIVGFLGCWQLFQPADPVELSGPPRTRAH